MGIFEIVAQNWVDYVFGSYLYAGLFVMLAFVLYGFMSGWDSTSYAVVLLPLMLILADTMGIFTSLKVISLLVAGSIIGLALKKFLDSR